MKTWNEVVLLSLHNQVIPQLSSEWVLRARNDICMQNINIGNT